MRLVGRLRNVCPHILSMEPTQDEAGNAAMTVQYAFETPVGTLDYFCMYCNEQRSAHAVQVLEKQMKRALLRDPNKTLTTIVKDKKQANKLIKKINRLGGAP